MIAVWLSIHENQSDAQAFVEEFNLKESTQNEYEAM